MMPVVSLDCVKMSIFTWAVPIDLNWEAPRGLAKTDTKIESFLASITSISVRRWFQTGFWVKLPWADAVLKIWLL